MFIHLLNYETRFLFRSPTFWTAMAILAAACTFGLYNGRTHYQDKMATIDRLRESQRVRLDSMQQLADRIERGLAAPEQWYLDPTNPLVVGHFRMGATATATIPTHPVQALAVGNSDLYPEAWRMHLTGIQPLSNSTYANPAFLASGAFDLAFALSFVLPLLLLGLSYNLVSRDREQGTLALIQAQPVSAARIYWFRLCARFLLILLFVTGILIPLLEWAEIGAFNPTGGRILLWTAAYGFIWIVLAMAINFWRKRSSLNALIAIGVWLLFAVLLPSGASMLTQMPKPIPSRATLLNAYRELDLEQERHRDSLLGPLYAIRASRNVSPEEGWRTYWEETFFLEDLKKPQSEAIHQQFRDKVEMQASYYKNLRFLSPAMAFYDGLTRLAGNSQQDLSDQEGAMMDAQKLWAGYFRNKFERNDKVRAIDYDALQVMAQPKMPLPGDSQAPVLLVQALLLILLANWWIFRKGHLLPGAM